MLSLSPLREGRDRAAASWNVAIAGVEGLLALPLFVVTVVIVGGAGVASLFRSLSSDLASFLPGAGWSVDKFSTRSASFFPGSLLICAFGFSVVFESLPGRDKDAASGVGGICPFCLLVAEDPGRALPLSALEASEFCLARDEAGRGALDGAGDARVAVLGSGREDKAGDEVAEGGCPDGPFLLGGLAHHP